MDNRHHIQRSIIRVLLSCSTARYAELRPKNIESNLFVYHLKILIREKIVEKNELGYSLSAYGKRYVDRLSKENMTPRLQPKVITILVIRNDHNEYLVMERLHQPFLSVKGFPSGKVHFGEIIQHAAVRELREKADLSGEELTLRGNVILHFNCAEKASSHVIGYVFTGQYNGARSEYTNPFFRTYWGSKDELMNGKVFKGHEEILSFIESKSIFIKTLTFNSEY